MLRLNGITPTALLRGRRGGEEHHPRRGKNLPFPARAQPPNQGAGGRNRTAPHRALGPFLSADSGGRDFSAQGARTRSTGGSIVPQREGPESARASANRLCAFDGGQSASGGAEELHGRASPVSRRVVRSMQLGAFEGRGERGTRFGAHGPARSPNQDADVDAAHALFVASGGPSRASPRRPIQSIARGSRP